MLRGHDFFLRWTKEDMAKAREIFEEGLQRFPGLGGSLVIAGLRSPVIRNRNMAAKALGAWPRSEWPEGAHEAVREAASDEPVSATREVLEQLVAEGTTSN